MKNNKMMKTMISTACAAVLAVGLMGAGPASAASAQQNTAPTENNLKNLQSYLEQWLQDNGGSYILKYQLQFPGAGQVTKPETSKPETSKPETSKPETSKPETSKPETSKPETSKPTETTKPDQSTSKPSTGSGTTSNQSSYAAEVIKLVNQERAKAGLKALTENTKLSGMAMDKAKDMNNNNYFDHNSPTYGSPFDMMKKYGISFSYAGENIAKGQKTPSDVMTAWMNSEGHRANILNSNYTTIGVAYYNGYWVQEFIAN
ncbi:CAP domain-containing protein [Paenibacillus dokdonensis]|uniref:CAP domain-containing protein n=1 Tax=Paenibacillus dokdonensis TaxID=2567944 RepID=A0ABU6GUW3_9BACL|nr:CAP domain-containing protein [Paenibacillus dokdonensis]MEC0242922.1 CAP domain-containing protein [Paenibacillus dokdonensis]